jgi:DNA-binding winged helix-turn-helix (wHTH) protein/TolB-like protein/tetratricopeptide (TPR) repeat protein
MNTTAEFRVGDWLIHPSLNRMSRGGETASLQPRFMDLLVFLAERPGQVVSKEEILDGVWAKEFVSEGTLTHAVAVIRQTLGDDVRSPRYIETIPTRGYRVIAPVRRSETADRVAPVALLPSTVETRPVPVIPLARRRSPAPFAGVAIGLLALGVAGFVGLRSLTSRRTSPPPGALKRIVVLPFQNLGPVERDYLAQGITDDVTTRLAAAHGVSVVSRTTATYYARNAKSAPQIADTLGVGYILEGTVRWEADRPQHSELRVNAQLIRASTDTLVWGESYRVDPAALVVVGATIAGRVVQQLGLTVRGPEQTRLTSRSTSSSDAYQAFLCGMRYRDRESPEQLGLAAAMFERAVTLDPSYALAYADLALVHARVYGLGIDTSAQRAREAARAAERAAALGPDMPETHLAAGAVDHLVKGDFVRALAEYRRAEQGLPSDSEISVLIADVYRRQGRWPEARGELERTVESDPGNYTALLALGDTLSPLHAYDEADRAYQRASNVSPDRIDPYVRRVWNYLRWDGTTERAERVLGEAPLPDDPAVLYCRSYLAYVRRDYRGALSALAGAGDEAPAGPFRLPGKRLLECLYLDAAGNPGDAATSCRRALDRFERGIASDPSDPWPRLGAALADASLGHSSKAVDEAARGEKLCAGATDASERADCLLEQAEVLARAGRAGETAAILQRLLEEPGPVSIGWLRLDPGWDRIRTAAAFQAIVNGPTATAR